MLSIIITVNPENYISDQNILYGTGIMLYNMHFLHYHLATLVRKRMECRS